jgi:hypothetical protein
LRASPARFFFHIVERSFEIDARFSIALGWARWRTFSSAPAKVSPSAMTY